MLKCEFCNRDLTGVVTHSCSQMSARLGDVNAFWARDEGVRSAQSKPDADGWIEWNGGECPVDGSTKVAVMVDGVGPLYGCAGAYRWEHQGDRSDITSYRLAEPAKADAGNPISALDTQVGESDPSGIDAHTAGAKLDAGKSRVWLCIAGFSRALEAVAAVTTKGAEKYTPNGWMEVADGESRYLDAFGRHALKLGTGERIDADTQCLHKAQMIWNLLASLELELRAEGAASVTKAANGSI